LLNTTELEDGKLCTTSGAFVESMDVFSAHWMCFVLQGLDYNKLTALPESIGSLPLLKYL